MTRLSRLSALALLYALWSFLVAPAFARAAGPVRWVTDKAFAHSVYVAVKDTYPTMTITCRRPLISKKIAVSVGVPQEDCLIIASGGGHLFCGEFAYENGPIPPTEIDCVTVARSFQVDVKKSDILHFRHVSPTAA